MYPDLVGRLLYPDSRIQLSASPCVHEVFSAVARLAADDYRLSTLFKILDRCCRGGWLGRGCGVERS